MPLHAADYHGDLFEFGRAAALEPQLTPEGKFLAFHEANPHIYRALVKLAREVKAKGYHHYVRIYGSERNNQSATA